MKVDRERFLALALGLAACHHGPTSPADERHHPPTGAANVLDDPGCTGFDLSIPKCVAWKKGGVAAGYSPTDECVRWDEGGRCTATEFVRPSRGD